MQVPQQVPGGLEELHGPRVLQLEFSMFKAPFKTFAATLARGTGETAALGAATATVLESARMDASEEIVSPRIISILCMQ